MRPRHLLPAMLLLAPTLAAQEFTGTISMRMTRPGSNDVVDTKVHVRDGKQAMVMTSPTGPMAGSAMRIVMNPAANRMTMLIATDMLPGAKGLKQVSEMPSADAGSSGAAAPTAKSLGTHQTIIGMRCDDYEVTIEGQTIQMCVTEALGRFSFPDMSPNGRGRAESWTSAFGDRAVFPLKLTRSGGMSMEVTGVDRTAPAAALFDENPEGYMTAPTGMPGMRRN